MRRAVVPAVALLAGCLAGASKDSNPEVVARLLELERQATSGMPVSGYASGDDPFRVRILPGHRTLVLLRGASELVLLDKQGEELDRAFTPDSPAGWAFVGPDRVLVAGELSSFIRSYRITADALVSNGVLTLDGVQGIGDLEWLSGPGILLAADREGPRIVVLSLRADESDDGLSVVSRQDVKLETPALELRAVGSWLLVNELLAHRLLIVPLAPTPDFEASTRIQLDGPIWSVDAVETGDGLRIAIGAAEDHPLDRSGGEFGYVDSYLYLYDVPSHGAVSPYRSASLNLSAEGVITPKALRFSEGVLTVTAYGSERLLRVIAEPNELRVSKSIPVPAGTADLDVGLDGRLVLANPLLDAVFDVPPDDGADVTLLGRFSPGSRSFESRLGEMIFFTTLIAPANVSDDHHSRFTCETCHFEGEVDGRTHYTGRGSVFASTKTLRGLAGNVPVFSRGGDSSLTSMVMAEFDVANQFDPWFALDPAAHPSLALLLETAEVPFHASVQRQALLTFLIEFGHRRNPARSVGVELTELEREGLGVFRDRCSACHQPLTSTRETGRFVPFEEWDEWLTDPQTDLVWGAPLFFKTGIEPYVSDRGARAPSLRRVSRKLPYFTNGSSPTLEDVLRRFRVTGPSGLHAVTGDAGEPDSRPLSDAEIDALLAVLRRF